MEENVLYNEKDIILKWNADMYDCNETDIQDVEFAISVIGTEPKRILEIACGSGRMLVPMAKEGHIVTGLDFDECMLDKIASKAYGMENIAWRKSDVTHDDWGQGFDVVVLAANFLLNIVSDTDYEKAQKLMIQKAAESLVLGGHIFIDYAYTLYPEKWFNNPNEKVVWEGMDSDGNTGRMVLSNSIYDENRCMCHFIRKYELTLPNGSVIVQAIPSAKHFVTLEQVHEWLSFSGFIIEKEYGDYRGNPIGEKTGRAIIWARKV